MKIILSCLVAMLLATAASAADVGDDVFGHATTPAQAQAALRTAMPTLGRVQVLRGRFSQRKFLRELPRPLLSTGEFLLVRDRGIWWHTQTPLDSTLMLTPGGLLAQDAGAKAQSRNSRQQPGLELAASMFFGLFALDLDTLARSFDLFETGSGKHWLLGLRPRDAALAAWFEKAILSGSAQVQQVTLFEAAGDRTEINLNAAAQPLTSLTPAERKRFEH